MTPIKPGKLFANPLPLRPLASGPTAAPPKEIGFSPRDRFVGPLMNAGGEPLPRPNPRVPLMNAGGEPPTGPSTPVPLMNAGGEPPTGPSTPVPLMNGGGEPPIPITPPWVRNGGGGFGGWLQQLLGFLESW